MKPELKQKIIAYNKKRKAVDEKLGDFQTILDNLPPRPGEKPYERSGVRADSGKVRGDMMMND